MIAASFAIRPATDIDRRKLVPALAARSIPSGGDLFIAFSPGTEALLGAGAVWFRPSRTFPEHAECHVHVGEAYRGIGIGRALINHLTTRAREVGARELRTPPLEQGSASFGLALACGFQPTLPTITYEAPMESYIKAYTPVYERLVERGRMPAGARMIPLSEANRGEVCRLLIDHLGFPARGTADRLRGTEQGFSQTISRVALLNGKMVGVILATYHGIMAAIEGTVVLPEHRHTWVASALKYHIMNALIAQNVKRVQFSASESQHRDTANFGRRLPKARVVKTVGTAVLDLCQPE
ncbi:MAG TPA: GNAT family N-acetyltransferase [Chthoniobacterales bacterium]